MLRIILAAQRVLNLLLDSFLLSPRQQMRMTTDSSAPKNEGYNDPFGIDADAAEIMEGLSEESRTL